MKSLHTRDAATISIVPPFGRSAVLRGVGMSMGDPRRDSKHARWMETAQPSDRALLGRSFAGNHIGGGLQDRVEVHMPR